MSFSFVCNRHDCLGTTVLLLEVRGGAAGNRFCISRAEASTVSRENSKMLVLCEGTSMGVAVFADGRGVVIVGRNATMFCDGRLFVGVNDIVFVFDVRGGLLSRLIFWAPSRAMAKHPKESTSNIELFLSSSGRVYQNFGGVTLN